MDEANQRPYDPIRIVSRYYNPANEIRIVGRKIMPGSFSELAHQAKPNEVIFASYRCHPHYSLVASHIDSQGRINQIYEECLRENDSYAPVEFYALDKAQANQRTEPRIP